MTTRNWLHVAAFGCGLIVLAMLVSGLVIADKETFGGLVGPNFLPVITSGVFVGAILLLVGAWKLPVRNSWRGRVLMLWALIALTSPLFGIMFLLPWGLLVLTLPVVIAIFVALYRAPATAPA